MSTSTKETVKQALLLVGAAYVGCVLAQASFPAIQKLVKPATAV